MVFKLCRVQKSKGGSKEERTPGVAEQQALLTNPLQLNKQEVWWSWFAVGALLPQQKLPAHLEES